MKNFLKKINKQYLLILYIIFIVLLSSQLVHAQSYEQVAIDFFVDSLLEKKYLSDRSVKRIIFNQTTANEYVRFLYGNCFKHYKNAKNYTKKDSSFVQNYSYPIQLTIKKYQQFFRIKKTILTKKLAYLIVKKAQSFIPDTFCVEIIFEQRYMKDTFYFDIDKNTFKVIKWCETGVVY